MKGLRKTRTGDSHTADPGAHGPSFLARCCGACVVGAAALVCMTCQPPQDTILAAVTVRVDMGGEGLDRGRCVLRVEDPPTVVEYGVKPRMGDGEIEFHGWVPCESLWDMRVTHRKMEIWCENGGLLAEASLPDVRVRCGREIVLEGAAVRDQPRRVLKYDWIRGFVEPSPSD